MNRCLQEDFPRERHSSKLDLIEELSNCVGTRMKIHCAAMMRGASLTQKPLHKKTMLASSPIKQSGGTGQEERRHVTYFQYTESDG